MTTTAQKMPLWLEKLLGQHPDQTHRPLEEFVNAAPRLEALSDVASGTPVLVRGDVDCKPGTSVGDGDVRLRSMLPTLRFGQERGWKQILLGHRGRDPEASLSQVRIRLQELLPGEVGFVENWLDAESLQVTSAFEQAIERCPTGGFVLLENTRKYEIERALWKAKSAEIERLAPRLAQFADSLAGVAGVYVNEAFSAGSLDASSTIVPAAVGRVALGQYAANEFAGPVLRCRDASLVVFSGLKADKLDDLEGIVNRGKVRMVIAAGSLAMALLKGRALLDGADYCLGVAEAPSHVDKPYYIPPERIRQATRMIFAGRENNVEFVLPVDFVLADGSIANSVPPDGQQLDVGPATSDAFAHKVSEFLETQAEKVVFHNGVFGKFEDPAYEEGTRKFVLQFKRMKDKGAEVYVGGGEGGKALERYGQPEWVTHCFTAGGTVLNALGDEPIPYLLALHMASQ
ncbi:MAG: phosphoglycerate kinase [Pirellulales bacterium]|nr:phosphoglycerate kinase [Pirellulales bacterium]